MPVVNKQEQLPAPFVATHREELSPPVILTHQSQLPVHVMVPGQDNFGENDEDEEVDITVTADETLPSLPGDIKIRWVEGEITPEGRPPPIKVVIITSLDQSPLPGYHWKEEGPVFFAHHGSPHAHKHFSDEQLFVHTVKKDRLLLPIHVRYKFLAPDKSQVLLPPDWYCVPLKSHDGYI